MFTVRVWPGQGLGLDRLQMGCFLVTGGLKAVSKAMSHKNLP